MDRTLISGILISSLEFKVSPTLGWSGEGAASALIGGYARRGIANPMIHFSDLRSFLTYMKIVADVWLTSG